ncbi:hypothetical protein D3C76_1597780 [compost metagenome]
MRLGGGLDVPGDQLGAEGFSQLFGQHGLAGTGLALDQQRPLQGNRCVDRKFEVVCSDVCAGAFELHLPILERIAKRFAADGIKFMHDYNAGSGRL